MKQVSDISSPGHLIVQPKQGVGVGNGVRPFGLKIVTYFEQTPHDIL